MEDKKNGRKKILHQTQFKYYHISLLIIAAKVLLLNAAENNASIDDLVPGFLI